MHILCAAIAPVHTNAPNSVTCTHNCHGSDK